MTQKELQALIKYGEGEITIEELANTFRMKKGGKFFYLRPEKLKQLFERKRPIKRCATCKERFTCWTE